MTRNPLKNRNIAFAAAALWPCLAPAHLTLERGEAAAGSTYKAVLQVPHGCKGSPTMAVRHTCLRCPEADTSAIHRAALAADTPEFPLATVALAPLRAKAEAAGSGNWSPLWSGQNASGCREVGAGVLTRELARLL